MQTFYCSEFEGVFVVICSPTLLEVRSPFIRPRAREWDFGLDLPEGVEVDKGNRVPPITRSGDPFGDDIRARDCRPPFSAGYRLGGARLRTTSRRREVA